MLKIRVPKNTFFIQIALLVICITFARGCGSAGDLGACKPVNGAGSYTASTKDLDGKDWSFEVKPDKTEISCYTAKDAGEIVFSGVIKNSQGVPQAGLVSVGVLSGEQGSLARKEKDKVVVSDSCGSVSYTLTWTCPPIGLSVGGDFVAKSGGLLSSPAKITIVNVFPTANATVTTTTTSTTPVTPAVPVATP